MKPKGTWRETEARLDPEGRSVFNIGASFPALGQISAVCDFSLLWGRFLLFATDIPGSPQSSQEPVCLPAVVPGTKVDINNVVERKKERREGGRRKEDGAEGARQEGAKGVREKGRNKPGQVIKNQKKSEELSWHKESTEASSSGPRTAKFHVFVITLDAART